MRSFKKVIEKVKSAIVSVISGGILATAAATPCYAAITDAGKNAGTLIQEQGYYIALGIVVIMFVKFLLKKAWVPAVAFAVVGGILLFIVSAPDTLKSIGQALYSVLVR